MYLMIRNKGEIDILALTLMGATSKEGDSSKIGFFGSGNKYAITTLLRHNIGLRIFSGLTEYVVTTREVSFRDTVYQQVLVNGETTSLTTRMGPAWEPWMAIREFYCNAVDEGLIDFCTCSEVQEPLEGETAIYITLAPEIQSFLDNIDQYINEVEPLDSLKTAYGLVDIIDNQEGHRYRKNIACVLEGQKSLFSYNFDNIQINESRILDLVYQQYEQIACALAMTENPDIVVKVLGNMNNEDLLESRALWDNGYCQDKLSSTWEAILLGLGMPLVSKSLAEYVGEKNTGGLYILPDIFVNKVKRDLPRVPIFGGIESSDYFITEPSEELVEEVNKCSAELESWGFKDITIVYCKFLRSDILGQYKNNKILISVSCPLDQVIYTIHEELIHRDTGYADYSRDLQTWLFERVVALERKVHALGL